MEGKGGAGLEGLPGCLPATSALSTSSLSGVPPTSSQQESLGQSTRDTILTLLPSSCVTLD